MAQYDNCAKRLLAEKIVLAFLLKNVVSEFADCTLEEIRDRWIEGIEIAQKGVEIDETNAVVVSTNDGSAITGENVESVTKTEGKITYDILFQAVAPSTQRPIQLIINVEAQKSDPREYEMVTRGYYYCSRMISAQKGTIFNKSEYQKLRKVYSIWVCMNPKAERRNTANLYTNEEHQLVGNYKADKRSYDLASVVILNLDPEQESDVPILNFFEVLFSHTKEPAEKKQALREDYGIETTSKMEKEMSEMCNLSVGVWERGMKEGMAEGIEKGMEKGMEEGMALGQARGQEHQAKQTVQNLWTMGFKEELIAKAVGYPLDTVRHWLNGQPA